jgi:hypothetical protein
LVLWGWSRGSGRLAEGLGLGLGLASPSATGGLLRRLLLLIRGLFCGTLKVATKHRSIVFTGAAPDRQPQVKILLAGAFIDLVALLVLHQLG